MIFGITINAEIIPASALITTPTSPKDMLPRIVTIQMLTIAVSAIRVKADSATMKNQHL